MSQKPAIYCDKCGRRVSRLIEVSERRSDLVVVWGSLGIVTVGDGNTRFRPKGVEAVCDCGNKWRLRKISSLDELKFKFGLRKTGAAC